MVSEMGIRARIYFRVYIWYVFCTKKGSELRKETKEKFNDCLLYTTETDEEGLCLDLGGWR
ncbi:hypothetical protein BGV18_19385 [Clostridioides difficile]|nr:hypothetical protein BGV18_19385 [Clostridioides difficile]